MFVFLYNTFGCILRLITLQVFILQVLSTKCDTSTSISFVGSERYCSCDLVHLQVFKFQFFTRKFSQMPVVTRSMAKRHVTESNGP
jgi:hypothetical protein